MKMLKRDWIALCEQQTAEINKLRDACAERDAKIVAQDKEIAGLKRALAAPAVKKTTSEVDPFDRRKVERSRGYWNLRVRKEFENTFATPARALAAVCARSPKPIRRVVCKRDSANRLWLNVYPSA